jgi:signal peptidase I
MPRNKHYSVHKGVMMFIITLGSLLIPIFVITYEYNPIVIMSGSMKPALNVGDVVLVQHDIDFQNVHAGSDGDILVIANSSVFMMNGVPAFMYDDIANNTPIIHRAIQKFAINGSYYFVTKGDNNPYPDGCVKYSGSSNSTYCIIEFNYSNPLLIPERYILGKVIFIVPSIGFLKIWSWQILLHSGAFIAILSIYKMKKRE